MSDRAISTPDGGGSPAIKRKDSEVLMRMNTMSPKSPVSDKDALILSVELEQLTDIPKLFESAHLDVISTPNMMVQAVLVDGSGNDVHPDERFESDRVSDLEECFPINSDLEWTFGRSYSISQASIENLYVQIRIMTLIVKMPEEPLSPQAPVASPTRQTKGGIRSSPGIVRKVSMRRTSSFVGTPKRANSMIVDVNIRMIATAEISLSCFPIDGSPYTGTLALKDGSGFKAASMNCGIASKFVLKPKIERVIEEDTEEAAANMADGVLKKFYEFQIEPSAGKIGSLPQRGGSRRTRVLSISGRLSDNKAVSRGATDISELGLGTSSSHERISTRESRHSLTDKPTHDSETEQLIRHMDSTFNNTLMVISDRFTKLDVIVKAGKAKEKETKSLEFIVRMVKYLGDVNTVVTMVTRACDAKTRIASSSMEPDTVEDGMATCKYILSIMLNKFTMMMGKLKNKIRLDIDVDKLVLQNGSCVADALELIDGSF